MQQNKLTETTVTTTATTTETTTATTTAAVQIAKSFPDALFCGFRLVEKQKGKFSKIPISKSGDGVSRDMGRAREELITADEIIKGYPQLGEYWGIVLQDPLHAAFSPEVLTVLDLDTKNSDAPPSTQIKRLIEISKERGLFFEASHSGKGAHIMFMAMPDSTLPKKIELGNKQEIEIFGHPGGGGKSVMLTGNKIRGDFNSVQNVRELLAAAGIDVDKKQEPKRVEPVALQRRYNPSEQYALARDALEYMNSDMHYDDWVKVGMALVAEFGADGEALWLEWSKNGNSWDDANIKKAKSFKGHGISMGTFFHMAGESGWKRPSKTQIERTTADQDFAEFIVKAEAATEDPAIAMEVASELVWKPVPYTLSKLEPITYLIDSFIAESFMVLVGQPGTGKTTGVIPICLAAIGFQVGCLSTKRKRKVIYVTEDVEQVRRILFAYVKFLGFDQKIIEENLIIIEAKRVNAATLSTLRQNVILETVNDRRPLLVLDTASATMQLKDENDNAGVADFISCLKEDIFIGLKAPIIIVAHTAKALGRNDEDASARGASAWEGDATLTATLFLDDGERYIKLRKTRYEPEIREIRLETNIESIPVFNDEVGMQDITLTWAIPQESSKDARENKRHEERAEKNKSKVDELHTKLLDLVSNTKNPVIKLGNGGAKNPPEDMTPIYLTKWISENFTGSSEDQRNAKGMLVRMLGLENESGWVRVPGGL